ncbi:Imm10 family immunity protein [Streptomyces sp. Je 1-79]|nr:Imm10 family immunity protein [Streptomyces sp. Je 1-79]MCT4352614.1 Imm10 family immunity protein [Streptomyces sp. Je 1-79]
MLIQPGRDIRFTARVASTEIGPEGYFTEAGLAEDKDGSGFILMFMAGEAEPDEQEAALGMDTHCLVTAGQGTAYGCVREAVLEGNVLRILLIRKRWRAFGSRTARLKPSSRRRAETSPSSGRSSPRCSPTGERTLFLRCWRSDLRAGPLQTVAP